MDRWSTIFRTAHLTIALFGALGLVACSGDDNADPTTGSTTPTRTVQRTPVRTPGGKGGFDILVAGDYKGTGTAVLGASSVSISATIKDDAGNVGSLVGDGQMSDDAHFSGTGTITIAGGSGSFTFDGRADAPDQGVKKSQSGPPKLERVIIQPRMSATFRTAQNHYARIAGQPSGATRPVTGG